MASMAQLPRPQAAPSSSLVNGTESTSAWLEADAVFGGIGGQKNYPGFTVCGGAADTVFAKLCPARSLGKAQQT